LKSVIRVRYQKRLIDLVEASRIVGITYARMCDRYRNGDRGARLFREPRRVSGVISQNLRKASQDSGVPESTIKARHYRGLSGAALVGPKRVGGAKYFVYKGTKRTIAEIARILKVDRQTIRSRLEDGFEGETEDLLVGAGSYSDRVGNLSGWVSRGSGLEGLMYGNWKVLAHVRSSRAGRVWLCECQCPAKTRVEYTGNYLKHLTSCGCHRGSPGSGRKSVPRLRYSVFGTELTQGELAKLTETSVSNIARLLNRYTAEEIVLLRRRSRTDRSQKE
jgi:hypothetical protein